MKLYNSSSLIVRRSHKMSHVTQYQVDTMLNMAHAKQDSAGYPGTAIGLDESDKVASWKRYSSIPFIYVFRNDGGSHWSRQRRSD